MQMVAASKMKRAQDQVLATREYAEKAWELLVHLASQPTEDEGHPLITPRPVQTTGLVLITGDKGLAGGYNHNIIRRALGFIKERQTPVKVVTVGRKGQDYMLRAGVEIVAEFSELPSQPRLLDVLPIAHVIMEDYQDGTFDEVHLAYTIFHNTITHEPVIVRLLPAYTTAELQSELRSGILPQYFGNVQPAEEGEYIYEPSARRLLDTIIPRFTELQIYQAMLESLASEHSARMVAMRNATENAQEMIEDLTLTYNRVRQEAITKEILDIAGGAEALAKLRV
jgi:F-type H+-transporting ATPase subunit gamma